jgi:CRP-like cAMP-binding protein
MRKTATAKAAKIAFDPSAFLAKVGEGKTISKFAKDETIFIQGAVADAVFYIQKGRIKLTVVSAQGKEAVVAIMNEGQFSAKDASMVIRCAWRPRRRWRIAWSQQYRKPR